MTHKSIASDTIPLATISCNNIPGQSLGSGLAVTAIMMNSLINCESLLKLKQIKSFIVGTKMFSSICKLRLLDKKYLREHYIPFTAISCNIPGKSLGMGVFVTIVMNISTNCESLLKLKQIKSFIAGTEMFPSICKLRLLDKK
ncbi:hypothetical protein H5410_043240 [Solanum commersonii]|uniref:Uncharacterized protein n=1 Tax=Solanum commersonii TaxID=4109 RepID=A0A9J5Y0U7_SOLCO|nr:hypothetical protein H5410_043240 [Solanum commersonii]